MAYEFTHCLGAPARSAVMCGKEGIVWNKPLLMPGLPFITSAACECPAYVSLGLG